MARSTEEQLHLAQEALEELLHLLSFPNQLTRPEAMLWAMLLRAVPIERTCNTCEQVFFIASPVEIRCPTCSMGHRSVSVPETHPQPIELARHMIGIQSGISLALRSLLHLQEQAPEIAQLLEDMLTQDRKLQEYASQQHFEDAPTPSVAQMIHTLNRVVRAWIELADGND